MVPSVHLNGTSKPGLLEPLAAARAALAQARTALLNASPHGRDYYPQGAGAYEFAASQHEGRIDKIAALDKELTQLMAAIDDPGQVDVHESRFDQTRRIAS
jgi:hypothetical protein